MHGNASIAARSSIARFPITDGRAWRRAIRNPLSQLNPRSPHVNDSLALPDASVGVLDRDPSSSLEGPLTLPSHPRSRIIVSRKSSVKMAAIYFWHFTLDFRVVLPDASALSGPVYLDPFKNAMLESGTPEAPLT